MSTSRVKLTKSFIDQLELIPAIYRDSEIIGFALRVNNSYKTYIVEKKVNGRAIRCKLENYEKITLEDARILAEQKLKALSDTNFLNIKSNSHKKNDQPNLSEAFQAYMKHHKLKERTLADYKKVIEKYLIDWREVPLVKLTQQMVEDKYIQLSKSSYATANLCMRVLRAIYSFSVKYYQNKKNETTIPVMNPVDFLNSKQLWHKVSPRQNYIEAENLKKWVHAIIEYNERGQKYETNKDFLLTLILTGFFRNECESLRWENIDLGRGTLSFVNTYNNEEYILYMGDFLWSLMKKRRVQIKGEWVFPSMKSESGHIVNISKVRKRINEKSHVSFTFQDLRNTFNFVVNNLSNEPLFIKKTNEKRAKLDDKKVIKYQEIRHKMNKIEEEILGSCRDQLIAEINNYK
ncbi:integrase family protein [Acinetobacter sp.]|jgi:integrase|uniref:integrase family protein n=1 Tax=Acinetobacter sp. TaxID=472 RepID=UPI00283977F7|nr:integrase family protein [Acinetobacter sp.]MDR2249870.1 integrase family protein [Acinetobacter sp.]